MTAKPLQDLLVAVKWEEGSGQSKHLSCSMLWQNGVRKAQLELDLERGERGTRKASTGMQTRKGWQHRQSGNDGEGEG